MLFLSVNIDVCDSCWQESGRELDRGLELERGFVDANLNVAAGELEGIMISRTTARTLKSGRIWQAT